MVGRFNPYSDGYPDRIAPPGADLCIEGMGRDDDEVLTPTLFRSCLRLQQTPKPRKCKPRPGLSLLWTQADPEPEAKADPATVARRAIRDYRKAEARIFGRAS